MLLDDIIISKPFLNRLIEIWHMYIQHMHETHIVRFLKVLFFFNFVEYFS